MQTKVNLNVCKYYMSTNNAFCDDHLNLRRNSYMLRNNN